MRYAILPGEKFYAFADSRFSEFLRICAEKSPEAGAKFCADTALQKGSGIKEHPGEFFDARKLSSKAAHEALASAAREGEAAKAAKEKEKAEAQIKALQEKLAALQAGAQTAQAASK